MKFIFLFEILGLLLFSSLFITEIQDIQDAGPLPQNTTLPTQTTREEVATINLNGTEISVLYQEYTGYSVIHPVTKNIVSFNSICLEDESACVFIDYYSNNILKVNNQIVEPDDILEIQQKSGTYRIPVYFLNPKDTIMVRASYLTEDIQIFCYDPAYCRVAATASTKQILELSAQWQTMSNADRSRYGHYFDPILCIDITWYQFNPVHSTSVQTGDFVKISIHENNQKKHFVKLETLEGFSYYELTDNQFNKLIEILNN